MRVKNNKITADVWAGMTIDPSSEYDLQPNELAKWQTSDKVVADLTTGDLLIGDGSTYKSGASEAVNFLLQTKKDVSVTSSPPFADKKILVNGELKSLFKRVHGTSKTIAAGQTDNIDFVVPYPVCKFSGAEVFGAAFGDTLNFKVLDDGANTYSGAPGSNYMLNQFGFAVEMSPSGEYANTSNYDADLYYGMVLRCEFTNNGADPKRVAVNLWLHEVKS